MNAIEQLQAESACRALIVRAASCADQQRRARPGRPVHRGRAPGAPGGEPLLGREAIFAAYAKRPADRMTRHLVTNTELEMLADGSVRAVSYALVIAGVEKRRGHTPGPQGQQLPNGRIPRHAGADPDRAGA